jgi:hypothetical protein
MDAWMHGCIKFKDAGGAGILKHGGLKKRIMIPGTGI